MTRIHHPITRHLHHSNIHVIPLSFTQASPHTDVHKQLWPPRPQTLAYLLPTLSLAIQRAEAEYEAAKVSAATQSRKQKREAGAARLGTVQAIIVVPSRELAMQIVRVAQSLLPDDARGAVQQCIGGANPHRQVCDP